jgi:hypothetical protein
MPVAGIRTRNPSKRAATGIANTAIIKCILLCLFMEHQIGIP